MRVDCESECERICQCLDGEGSMLCFEKCMEECESATEG